MKKLIASAIAIFLATASFQARAIIVIAPQTVSFAGVSDGVVQPNNCLSYAVNDDDIEWSSPALLPAPVPEPSSFALLVAVSAFAFCVFKDRMKV